MEKLFTFWTTVYTVIFRYKVKQTVLKYISLYRCRVRFSEILSYHIALTLILQLKSHSINFSILASF